MQGFGWETEEDGFGDINLMLILYLWHTININNHGVTFNWLDYRHSYLDPREELDTRI